MDFRFKINLTFVFIILALIFAACSTVNGSGKASSPRRIKGDLAIHFINVGQGDSTFINVNSSENILIDVGSPSGGPEVVRYLKTLGIKKLDHLIFTHPHDDHIGGIFTLLSEFEVTNYYDNGFSNFNSDTYGDYIKTVRENLAHYNILQAGESLHIGSLEVDVLNPLLPPTGNLNEDSIVLKLNFGETGILLSGDMGILGERRLLNLDTELTAEVIKVGHHGENDVCSVDFLKEVNPEAAIISVSRINEYARPHPELLARLENAGVKIYRTDHTGNIVVRSDGRTYSIKTENKPLGSSTDQ
jgi:competence protein ComEC